MWLSNRVHWWSSHIYCYSDGSNGLFLHPIPKQTSISTELNSSDVPNPTNGTDPHFAADQRCLFSLNRTL